jgi:hypothetical protein
MEWKDEFEPTSQINGNIEITFNSKNKEFDIYEPIQDQLVLTIGKTGRANRLTFDAPTSEELLKTAKVLKELGEQVNELEEEAGHDEEFGVEDIESGIGSTPEKKVLQQIPDESDAGISRDEIKEESDLPDLDLKDTLEGLMRGGEIYRTGNGKEENPEYAKV